VLKDFQLGAIKIEIKKPQKSVVF
jgi:hypothetical protein